MSFILIAVFALMLAIPAVRMLTTPFETYSTAEKRKLAVIPEIRFNSKLLNEFPRKFENFFNDHFGHRKAFLRFYNYTKVVWFKQSPNKTFLVGKDDWLFLGMPDVVKDFRGMTKLSNEQKNSWADRLMQKERFFRQKGVQYLFVVEPDKKTIYPEYYPDHINQLHSFSKRYQLTTHLPKETASYFLDLTEPLLKAKNYERLYFKTDSHWNDVGAFVAYQSIIKKINQWYPEISIIQRSNLVIREVESIGGGNAEGLMLDDLIGENALVTELINPCSRILVSNGNHKNRLGWKDGIFPELTEKTVLVKGCQKSKLKAFVFHDSYMVALEPYLSEHFAKTYYLWNVTQIDIMKVSSKILDFDPDLVIEAWVERNLFSKNLR